MGMRNMLVKGATSDVGHILENVVYLELRRRGFEVYVGQLGRWRSGFCGNEKWQVFLLPGGCYHIG